MIDFVNLVAGEMVLASVKDPFVDLWKRMVNIGPKWLVAAGILIIAWVLARLARNMVRKIVGKTSTQGHVDIIVGRAVSFLILLAGVVAALSEVGMSLSAALAALGLASVGVGFALQDVLGNLFAGIILLLEHPFTIGDQVKIAGLEGMVENIKVRDTQILTYDGERIFIPNKVVFSNPIINFTSTPSLRSELKVGIKQASDIPEAKNAAMRAMRKCPHVIEQPEPSVMVDWEKEHIVLILNFWIPSDRASTGRVGSAVLEKVFEELAKENIGFLPQG